MQKPREIEAISQLRGMMIPLYVRHLIFWISDEQRWLRRYCSSLARHMSPESDVALAEG